MLRKVRFGRLDTDHGIVDTATYTYLRLQAIHFVLDLLPRFAFRSAHQETSRQFADLRFAEERLLIAETRNEGGDDDAAAGFLGRKQGQLHAIRELALRQTALDIGQ